MAANQKQPKYGKDSVVIGRVTGSVGEGSVVIGATDSQGNTIINQPMAVGRGASAGPGSIAIGAYASAGGNDLSRLAAELALLVEEMRQRANDTAQVQAIVEVEGAAEAAQLNDGPTVIARLVVRH